MSFLLLIDIFVKFYHKNVNQIETMEIHDD